MPDLWFGKSIGRPPKADKDFQAALARAIEQNPHDLGYPFTRWSVDLLTGHTQRTTLVDVSCSTVYHTLRRLGYRYGCPKLDLKHRQYAPNLSLIERFWGYLKRSAIHNYYFETVQNLGKAIMRAVCTLNRNKNHPLHLNFQTVHSLLQAA